MPNESRMKNVLSIIAIVLGLVAAPLSFYSPYLSWVIAIVSVFLGIAGRKDADRKIGIAGIVVPVICLVVALANTVIALVLLSYVIVD